MENDKGEQAMKKLCIEIEDYIWREMKEKFLKTKTWREVVNEALSKYLQEYEDDELKKRMLMIIEAYYKVKEYRRIIAMARTMEKIAMVLMNADFIESSQTMAEIAAKIHETVTELKKKLEELENKTVEKYARHEDGKQ